MPNALPPPPPGLRRVVLVSNGLRLGGAEGQTAWLAAALASTGVEVEVLAIYPSRAHEAKLADAGVRVRVVGGERPSPLRTLWRTWRALRELRPDVVVSFVFQANVLAIVAARLARVPRVLTSIRNERFGGRHRELLLRRLLWGSSLEVSNSERAAQSLIDRGVVRRDRLVVVPNALDIDRFDPTHGARDRIRKELDLADDDVAWFAIGRLEPQKDHETLIEAFQLARAHDDRIQLFVVGEGSSHRLVAQRAVGVAHMLGARTDVPDLLAAADGVVLSSRWEGSPNVILEAMAARLPVVATDVGGCAELVQDHVTGRVVPAADPEALAQAVVETSSLPPAERRRWGKAAHDLAAAKHDPAVVLAAWNAILTDAPPADVADDRHHVDVALFLTTFGGGGAQRAFLTLGRALTARGVANQIVVANPVGPLGPEAEDAGPIAALGARRASTAVPALARFLRRERPAVLVSTVDNANLAALAAARISRAKVATVVRISNHMTSLATRATTPSGRAVRRLVRHWYPKATVLVAPSRAAARDLDLWLGLTPGTARVVPTPIVDERMLQAARRRPGHPWFAPGEPPVILSLGRLIEHKRVDLTIDAFADVLPRHPCRLLIVGEGERRSALELHTMSRGLRLGPDGDVHFTGFDADPWPLLAASRVYVLASEHEGLPNALIQALACGTEVISADCPSGPSEVLAGGRWGRLVRTGDRADLADALDEVLSRPPRAPDPRSWAPYTIDAATADWIDLLNELGIARSPAGVEPWAEGASR